MHLALIVAMTEAGVIGRGLELPWRLPDDLARFKRLTWGHPLVMGRRTWDSLGRPLPGRTSIVLTSRPASLPAGVLAAANLDEALAAAVQCEAARLAAPEPPAGEMQDAAPWAFVIGGAEVYRQALPRADRLYVTWVEGDAAGDVFFPPWDQAVWRRESSERREADARHPFARTFCLYSRSA